MVSAQKTDPQAITTLSTLDYITRSHAATVTWQSGQETKFSIITASFNSGQIIHSCLRSVDQQTHHDVEHIVIDGSSADNTVARVRSFPRVSAVVSEPDEGLYDAMNKGIALATGEVVGILNSDDFYASDAVLAGVAKAFEDPLVDATIGDIAFVDSENLTRITRYYSARRWQPAHFRWGFMPPHPAFFVRRRFYEQLGTYRTDYRIAADYELLVRFLLKARLRFAYLGGPLVFMRSGGASNASVKSRILASREMLRACRENDVPTSHLMLSARYIWKVWEFIPSLRG